MSKGILQVHPPICDCPGCRISSPVNRGRLAEKRTIPLPPNRVPKKELASIFSSDDSEGSERASGDHAHIKQEDELHYSIMRKRRLWLASLAPFLSLTLHLSPPLDFFSLLSLCISKAAAMYAGRHRAGRQYQAFTLVFSLTALSLLVHVFTDALLGKRRSFSPNSSSECPSDNKKSRSVSPKGKTKTPRVRSWRAGGSHGHMSPEEHYRRMMSALSEQGSFEEQQQRLYQLASSMGLHGHDMLRARQEALAAAVRNPVALEAHLPSAGSSSSSSQRRKQGLPQHRDAHYTDRDLSHPPALLSPPTAPHIALGPHLRPPFLGMPSALCHAPGYGFLQPAQAEIFARQQEMLRKQNLARCVCVFDYDRCIIMNITTANHLHDIPEGHPLREELARRSNAMLVLRHGASTPLLTLNHQQQLPGVSSTPKDSQAQSSAAGPDAESRKTHRRGPQIHKNVKQEQDRLGRNSSFAPSVYIDTWFSPTAARPGSVGGLFMDGEDSATANPAEDISKWSVEDVCGFISSLAGCAEYTQVFREQAIDGETLPLLTEEHLLSTMGLKLGPALKIRSQVARRVGRLFYMTGFPLAFPFPPSAALRPTDRDRDHLTAPSGNPLSSSSPYRGPTPGCSTPKQENGTGSTVAGRFEAKTPS
uniref:Sterile alpha motif domain containing 11 n=1 Tax=Scophthalmus maximus TaxID=52904 RepID=A0A8D3B8K1_SCOMX